MSPLCHPMKGTSHHHFSVKSKQSISILFRLRRLRSRSSRDAVCNWRPRPNATSKAFCATTWAGMENGLAKSQWQGESPAIALLKNNALSCSITIQLNSCDAAAPSCLAKGVHGICHHAHSISSVLVQSKVLLALAPSNVEILRSRAMLSCGCNQSTKHLHQSKCRQKTGCINLFALGQLLWQW